MAQARNIRPGRLRKHRRIARLTQHEVGTKLGHKDATIISRWERGIATPTLENALTLSKIYNTSVEELFYDLFKQCEEKITAYEKERLGNRDP